jgi:hypothetical protein
VPKIGGEKGLAITNRFIEALNAKITVLIVLGVTVAANSWLLLDSYLPIKASRAPASSSKTEPTNPGSADDGKKAPPVLVGAGDIADCDSLGDEATAEVLEGISGTVFTVGDNAYESGTAAEFNHCYGPTWGRYKARTKPAVGDEEYETPGASGYFGYFGAAAGDPRKGYYSYDLGSWHIVVLNSHCTPARGCASGSTQEQWLKVDLATHRSACTLAYWHQPRFSSSQSALSSVPSVKPFWDDLYKAGAEVVINGHQHNYERFAPQTPGGVADSGRGIREFVVGTGGAPLHPFGTTKPNSQVRNGHTHGVLKLTLRPGSYDWRFVPVAGQSFTDSGTTSCH